MGSCLWTSLHWVKLVHFHADFNFYFFILSLSISRIKDKSFRSLKKLFFLRTVRKMLLNILKLQVFDPVYWENKMIQTKCGGWLVKNPKCLLLLLIRIKFWFLSELIRTNNKSINNKKLKKCLKVGENELGFQMV